MPIFKGKKEEMPLKGQRKKGPKKAEKSEKGKGS